MDVEGKLGSPGCYWLMEAGKWLPGPRDSLEVAGKAASLLCLSNEHLPGLSAPIW